MISPLAIIVVVIPVIIAFATGIILMKSRQEPGVVKIPTYKFEEKKDPYLKPKNGVKPFYQNMAFRGGLAQFIHMHFPLSVEQLETLVPKIERLIFEELEKAGYIPKKRKKT